MKRLLPILLLLFASQLRADYALPAGRGITWYPAGLDVIGGIPTTHAHQTAVSGLHDGGVTDDTSVLQSAINNAANDTVLLIPAGVYKINGNVDKKLLMRSGVTLRGAQEPGPPWMPADNASLTTLKMTNGSSIFFRGGDKDSSWFPARQGGAGLGIAINSGYTAGSPSLTLSTVTGLAVNDMIAVYQNKDTSQIEDKTNRYLGEDCTAGDPHVWAQYVQITNIAGNVITIDPPLYQVTASPTGQSIRKQSFGISNAGLEDLRLFGDGGNVKLIWMQFTKFCWIKGVETYDVGASSSGSPHVWCEFSYANEIRRSYFHVGEGHDSGACYGIEFYHWNSRHKIEDNIVRETRHSIIFEGGGSGCAILYNYMNDNWESVQSEPTTPAHDYLSEDAVANHGAHPYMNLWEGNRAANWWGDFTLGSSSYNTAFRNWFTGTRANTDYYITSPYQYSIVEIEEYNHYYNVVGNVLGTSAITTGTLLDNNSGGTKPEIYRFGHSSNGGSYTDTASYTTAILHGNYDYVSDSVHDWVAGQSHTLPDSLYYSARPAFFTKMVWPPFDSGSPDNATETSIPAGVRYLNGGSGATPTPGPTGTPTPTPWPGISTGLVETGNGTQRCSSGDKSGLDLATLNFPETCGAGHFILVGGAMWGPTAPTGVTVSDNRGTSYTVALGAVTTDAGAPAPYRTFIAYGFIPLPGLLPQVTTVTVNPSGQASVHDFSWSMDEFENMQLPAPTVVNGGDSTSSLGTTATASDSINVALNAQNLIVGVMTHGNATVALSAAAGYNLMGKDENNATCQAHATVFRIASPGGTFAPGVIYATGSNTHAWTVQSYAFRAQPAEYHTAGDFAPPPTHKNANGRLFISRRRY